MARGARDKLYGHIYRSHGSVLHGRPSQEQAKVGARVGWSLCLRGRTQLYQHLLQGRQSILTPHLPLYVHEKRLRIKRRTATLTNSHTITTEYCWMPWSMAPTLTTSTPPRWWTMTPATLPTSSPRVLWQTLWQTSGKWSGNKEALSSLCFPSKNH